MIDRESFLNETGDPTSQSTKHVARELHDKGFETVSYTHLTLPTIYSV